MPTISRYLQLDVFPATPGGGNPLGVVLDADGWSDAQMQRFAAWTNLVETTFVLPPTQAGASYRLRIFTPDKEIPFAGHPTVGSAHAVLESGIARATGGRLVQECGAGLLPIRVEDEDAGRRLLVRAPAAHVLRVGAEGEPLLRDVLGRVRLGALPPAFVEGGRRWWVAEFLDEDEVRAWRPDHAAIARLARASDSLGLCVFARCNGDGHELVVRAFPAGVGIVEDPASGAANGLIAAWIAQREPAGPLARGYRVSQGREIGRDASLRVRIEGADVWVGGATTTVVRGEVDWPH
ncbi:PhzF family phenazine biosynthesis protein [Dokdonella fugitiva]|jgi:PhzF family phenazine biosynthesis protein|uniref:PhzF family phenazine biosynthesis protein n=1 Tax=Dokdonella fugitiva TaxID=328517 RepID=A0A4R2I8Y7_9GAMM|nr:PhzF family phenazine biosynthesis protein [Dokdonella fugitiva]MBA8884827.1 PhzF family phenazine biosynthesis protein [Dokdonella fugitiva]TCO40844.1 PhzF family phenazine biosynthesis protein [Dokdonella fugitiva]